MQPAQVQIFNLTSDKLLTHIRYKRILQIWSNLRSAQSIIGLRVTKCQFTSNVDQALFISRK